jgi:hypothetical protein
MPTRPNNLEAGIENHLRTLTSILTQSYGSFSYTILEKVAGGRKCSNMRVRSWFGLKPTMAGSQPEWREGVGSGDWAGEHAKSWDAHAASCAI